MMNILAVASYVMMNTLIVLSHHIWNFYIMAVTIIYYVATELASGLID